MRTVCKQRILNLEVLGERRMVLEPPGYEYKRQSNVIAS